VGRGRSAIAPRTDRAHRTLTLQAHFWKPQLRRNLGGANGVHATPPYDVCDHDSYFPRLRRPTFTRLAIQIQHHARAETVAHQRIDFSYVRLSDTYIAKSLLSSRSKNSCPSLVSCRSPVVLVPHRGLSRRIASFSVHRKLYSFTELPSLDVHHSELDGLYTSYLNVDTIICNLNFDGQLQIDKFAVGSSRLFNIFSSATSALRRNFLDS
jgi:hypothetical protein